MKVPGFNIDEKGWHITSRKYADMKCERLLSVEVSEGVNRYGDGPNRFVATFATEADAIHACDLHNSTLK